MRNRVSCLRKQHRDRDLFSNHRPPDQKSNALTSRPPGLASLKHTTCKTSKIAGEQMTKRGNLQKCIFNDDCIEIYISLSAMV